jgi:hypothetical protein
MYFSSQKHIVISGLVLLLATGPTSAIAQSAPSLDDISGYDGLLWAAHEGEVDTIATLIKGGADIEVRDTSGRTPLIVAAFASHDESVRILADAGADLNALESSAYDIVTIAAVANDLAMLDLALDLGANSKNITSPYDGTALIAAAHLGHHEVVDRLIKGNAPLDHINNLQWTALIEAVVLGDGGADHIETVRLLLEAGADRTIGDSQGVTPLEHAKSRGYEEMVQLFDMTF